MVKTQRIKTIYPRFMLGLNVYQPTACNYQNRTHLVVDCALSIIKRRLLAPSYKPERYYVELRHCNI